MLTDNLPADIPCLRKLHEQVQEQNELMSRIGKAMGMKLCSTREERMEGLRRLTSLIEKVDRLKEEVERGY